MTLYRFLSLLCGTSRERRHRAWQCGRVPCQYSQSTLIYKLTGQQQYVDQ